MNLKPMTDFVLETMSTGLQTGDIYTPEYKLELIEKYAQFLKQPLTLGMFVPCDEEGNYLKEQPEWCFANVGSEHFKKQKKYWEAKEKVLFKGFETDEDPYYTFRIKYKCFWAAFYGVEGKHIEYLLQMFTDVELTESAIKQIGYEKTIN